MDRTPRTSLRPVLLAGSLGLVVLLGGMGGWAATQVISGAVIASGQAVVEGKPQEVQHLDGGLISRIEVSDGDLVERGEVLIRLDPVTLTLRRDMSRTQLASFLARRERLRAERSGRDVIDFAYPDFPFDLPDMGQVEADERDIFEVRARARIARNERLVETQADLSDRIEGTRSRIASLEETESVVDEDRTRLEALSASGLVTRERVTELMRETANLASRRAELETELTTLTNQRRAAETEAAQAELQFSEDVAAELSEVGGRIEELALEITDLEAKLGRVEIRAPVGGTVHDMQVSTAGGVVAPGDTLMTLIPQERGVSFQVRVDPSQVDQVHAGQEAEVIVAAFDPRTTPRLDGRILWVSPDTIVDPQSGQRYFRTKIGISPEELARLGDATIIPGMPIEAYIKTTDRTIMSYLSKPLMDNLRHAMRE